MGTPTEQALRTALENLCDAADATNYPPHGSCYEHLWNCAVAARAALTTPATTLPAAPPQAEPPTLTFNGVPAQEFLGNELFAFQEATGCDVADQLAPHQRKEQAEPPKSTKDEATELIKESWFSARPEILDAINKSGHRLVRTDKEWTLQKLHNAS